MEKSRFLLQTSGILFIISGMLRAIYTWQLAQFYSGSSTIASFSRMQFIFDAYSMAVFLGLVLLIGQRRKQRRWFGWIGVVGTLVGLSFNLLLVLFIQFFPALETSQNQRLEISLDGIASWLYIFGFLLWALDLPNTSRNFLQKVAMCAIVLMPILWSFIGTSLGLGYVLLILINWLLEGGLWILLGVSVWLNRVATDTHTVPSPDPFADSSFNLITSAIPPSEL